MLLLLSDLPEIDLPFATYTCHLLDHKEKCLGSKDGKGGDDKKDNGESTEERILRV